MNRWRGLVLGGLLLLLSAGCSQPLTTSQQIIAVIRDMEARIEDGERRAFLTHIAEDFSGQGGRMSRDDVHAMIVLQMKRYQQLDARLLPIQVKQTGETTAEANFRVLVTGGAGWLPESGQLYEVDTRWDRQGGEWLLIGADWDPVPLEEVL